MMGQGQVARFGINNALKPDLILNLYKYYSTKASEQANFYGRYEQKTGFWLHNKTVQAKNRKL